MYFICIASLVIRSFYNNLNRCSLAAKQEQNVKFLNSQCLMVICQSVVDGKSEFMIPWLFCTTPKAAGREKKAVLWSVSFKVSPLCAMGVVVFSVMLLFNIRYLSCHAFFSFTVFKDEHRTISYFLFIIWKWILFCNTAKYLKVHWTLGRGTPWCWFWPVHDLEEKYNFCGFFPQVWVALP